MLRTAAVTVMLAGLASLAGCTHPTPVYYVVEAVPEAFEVPCEPPRQRLEVPPEPPSESCVWQAGYYDWNDDAWDWVPGTWVEPRPGYVYVEPSVVFYGGSWHYRRPYWRHHRHHRRDRMGPGHRPRGKRGVVARAPRGEGSRGKLKAHRAPPAHPVKHRAPAHEPTKAAKATKHRAPAHQPPGDPDRPAKKADAADAPRAMAMKPLAPGQLPPRADPRHLSRLDQTGRPRSIRIAPGPEAVATDDLGAITDIHRSDDELEPRSRRVDVESLRERPEFRGTRGGRMVFGDDPDDPRPIRRSRPEHDYPTDDTGAIVLASTQDTQVRPGVVRVRTPNPGIVVHRPRGRTFSHVRGERPPPHRMRRPWPGPRARLDRDGRSGWQHRPRVSMRQRAHFDPAPRQRRPNHVRPTPQRRVHRPGVVHRPTRPMVRHRPRSYVHRSPVRVHRPVQRVHRPVHRVHRVHRPAPAHRSAPARRSAPSRSSGRVSRGGGGRRRR